MRLQGVLYVGVETKNTYYINGIDISNYSTIVELDSWCLTWFRLLWIVKIIPNSNYCIFKSTHGNNLQPSMQLYSPLFCSILAHQTSQSLRTAIRTSFVNIVFQARLEKVTCFRMLCRFCVRYRSAAWTSPFPSPRTSSQKKSHEKILNGCWEKRVRTYRKKFPVL